MSGVSFSTHIGGATGTHVAGAIEHRHEDIERELETRQWRNNLYERVRSGRTGRRDRPGEEVGDGRAGGVAEWCGGRLGGQGGLVE